MIDKILNCINNFLLLFLPKEERGNYMAKMGTKKGSKKGSKTSKKKY